MASVECGPQIAVEVINLQGLLIFQSYHPSYSFCSLLTWISLAKKKRLKS
jgi:hypothetical protein